MGVCINTDPYVALLRYPFSWGHTPVINNITSSVKDLALGERQQLKMYDAANIYTCVVLLENKSSFGFGAQLLRLFIDVLLISVVHVLYFDVWLKSDTNVECFIHGFPLVSNAVRTMLFLR